MPGHDAWVMQRLADGQVPVKGHDAKEEALITTKGEEEVELCETTHKSDGLSCGEEVGQHVRHGGGDIAYFQEREIPQEDVHGSVKAPVCPHSTGDGCVARQGQSVGYEEEPKVEELPLWAGGKAHEDKVANRELVFLVGHIHWCRSHGGDRGYCCLMLNVVFSWRHRIYY